MAIETLTAPDTAAWDDYEALCMTECREVELVSCEAMCPPRCRSRIVNEDPLPVKRWEVRYSAEFVEKVRDLTGNERFPLEVVRAEGIGGDRDG